MKIKEVMKVNIKDNRGKNTICSLSEMQRGKGIYCNVENDGFVVNCGKGIILYVTDDVIEEFEPANWVNHEYEKLNGEINISITD